MIYKLIPNLHTQIYNVTLMHTKEQKKNKKIQIKLTEYNLVYLFIKYYYHQKQTQFKGNNT